MANNRKFGNRNQPGQARSFAPPRSGTNAGEPLRVDLPSYAAKLKGIGGLVVDGGIRDREEIVEFSFPAFSKHMVPTPGKTRIKVLSINEPIVCAGVRVRKGDVIVAHGTGVLCLPAEHAEEITIVGILEIDST